MYSNIYHIWYDTPLLNMLESLIGVPQGKQDIYVVTTFTMHLIGPGRGIDGLNCWLYPKIFLLSSQDFLKESLLKERLDNDTLEATGILPQKKTFQQKYVRLKTKLL